MDYDKLSYSEKLLYDIIHKRFELELYKTRKKQETKTVLPKEWKTQMKFK